MKGYYQNIGIVTGFNIYRFINLPESFEDSRIEVGGVWYAVVEKIGP